ncbi:MAG: hypothetical protein ACYYK0_08065 [Candidatus Eutrophobiaceae bacterium]
MPFWEQLLLGVGGLVVLLFFWPGVKEVMRRSTEAEERDWVAFLIPMAIAALFIVLLIVLSRGKAPEIPASFNDIQDAPEAPSLTQ